MVLFSNETSPEDFHLVPTNFPYSLSPWQKWAIWSIYKNHHTLVCAPTGSGKTCPAEFAIDYFAKMGKKIIYTSPIKALSNQKRYDFQEKFPEYSFGILTGDIKDNPEADVIIMTTEILKNNLSNRGTTQALDFNINIEKDVGIIIYDEAHYFNDVARGHVWEECFMMQPKNVPMLLMSATLHRPENFANWLEKISTKQVILAQTHVRQVPLYHYMWFSSHPSLTKKIKDLSLVALMETYANKPLLIQDRQFHERHYHKLSKLKTELKKQNAHIKPTYVMNAIVDHLHKQQLTPAICFIYSRKNVEKTAGEVTHCLHREDMRINLVQKECRQILMKLPNYEEYLHLPEYERLVKLLERGVAFHHSGMLPILREMVEIMFTKGYVQMLFATETFALGLNMPTKTVIFSQLSKYDGQQTRYLLGHEYTQQAGRAGRRGFDEKGVVIHLNNLFEMPACQDYREILGGKPQVLSSKFKISYGLVLEQEAGEIMKYSNTSMITDEVEKESAYYQDEITRLETIIKASTEELVNLFTPIDILEDYHKLLQNTDKNLQKILTIESKYRHVKQDYQFYDSLLDAKEKLGLQKNYLANSASYIQWNITQVQDILCEKRFMNEEKIVTDKGKIAAHFHEAHPLALADLLIETDYLSKMEPREIIGLLSVFTNINVQDDYRQWFVPLEFGKLKYTIDYLENCIKEYEQIEHAKEIYFEATPIQYDIIKYVMDWYDCEDEKACKMVVEECTYNTGIFIGDFVKAILKINNIATELESICLEMNQLELLKKVREIPEKTMKFVATNQSLYV